MTANINPYTNLKNFKQFFIDNRNKIWYDDIINSGYILNVQEDHSKKIGDGWVFSPLPNKLIVITCPLNDRNKNIFTHELLHSYLSVKGFYSINRYKILEEKKEKFEHLFSPLESGLLNALQHLKMYPIFCKAGYDPTQFVTDPDIDYKVNDRLVILQSDIPYEQFFKEYIELFSISINNPNKKDKYKSIMDELQKVDSELFVTLNDTTDNWLKQSDFYFDDLYKILVDGLADIFKKNH